MSTTRITTKSGETFTGELERWNPIKGTISICYFADSDSLGEEKVFSFNDLEYAITIGERISVNKIGDQDEIERARKYREYIRKHNQEGFTPETPKDEWEK